MSDKITAEDLLAFRKAVESAPLPDISAFKSFCQFMYQPSPCICGSKDIDMYNIPVKVVIHCRDCEREVESKYLLSAVEEWDAGR